MIKRYTHQAAEPIVSALLLEQGFVVARASSLESGYHLTANKNNVNARLLIKHLQFDECYKNSLLPYQVYKIKAFPNGKHDSITLQHVDFIIGYNLLDNSFACVPVDVYHNQGIACFHSKEGLRHEYFNSWDELHTFTSSDILPIVK
ncbi:hypothetical protein [Paenibacillus sp. FSL H8-0537]|uniref:group I intron-associated PD-(D/E)XK endonuclease n=1 Tax=Paenibacillus sp. FSL H8-0537 TaxID=2921399 RepID=UPI0031011438